MRKRIISTIVTLCLILTLVPAFTGNAHAVSYTANGVTLPTPGRGQRVSLERGVATRSKKNPGKRSKKGG